MFANTGKKPLYLDLYLKLRDQIDSGVYPPGSKLPSEKELAEEHGVSRITSKHALDRLAAEGAISRYPGKGSYILAPKDRPDGGTASSLPVSRKLIGVVMERVSPHFGGEILMGIEKVCADAGYSAVVKFSHGDADREAACIDELLGTGVDGIVLMCTSSEVYNARVLKLSLEGYPLVFIDRSLNGLPVPYVGTDHYAAAKELTHALVKHGHRHLALAMAEDSHVASSVEDRVHGYVQGCIENELFCANRRLLLMKSDAGNPEIKKANAKIITDYMEEHPETSAILALSSEIAISVLEATSCSSKKCTVAFFDGPYVDVAPNGMLCILQDQQAMGATACRFVIDMISGKKVPMSTMVPHILRS